jgi:hypothetical protein
MNRAFDNKSMKFGTHLEETLRKIFGYRAIAHFARNKNGSHFQNGRPLWLKAINSGSYFNVVLLFLTC